MLVNVKEFARHRGLSEQAIRKAIKEGKLGDACWKKGTAWVIDLGKADRNMTANTSGALRRTADQINSGKAAAQGKAAPSLQADGQALTYSKARAYGEGFKAKLLELEFREKSGQLVRVDEVETATFKLVRTFRDAIQNIPIRVVNELAAVVGDLEPAKKHEMLMILQREVTVALEELSDGIS